MKKKFKKAVAVILTAAMAMSVGVPAFASTAWDNAWYKPYQASVSFQRTYVQGYNMKWDADQIITFLADECWELEFRPCDMIGTPLNPNVIYDANAGYNLVTTLPDAYKEFDEDDVSIGVKHAKWLTADEAYMGTLYFTSNSANAGTTYRAVVENEYGAWIPIVGDGVPIAFVQWDRVLTIGEVASW